VTSSYINRFRIIFGCSTNINILTETELLFTMEFIQAIYTSTKYHCINTKVLGSKN